MLGDCRARRKFIARVLAEREVANRPRVERDLQHRGQIRICEGLALQKFFHQRRGKTRSGNHAEIFKCARKLPAIRVDRSIVLESNKKIRFTPATEFCKNHARQIRRPIDLLER